MENNFYFKTLLASTTSFILSICSSIAMDDPSYFAINSKIATSLEQKLAHERPGQNIVVCPVGPLQLFADLCQTADIKVVGEILNFTGSTFEIESYEKFLETLPQNIKFPMDISQIYNLPSASLPPKKAYFNSHFIIINNTYNLKEERSIQLKKLQAIVASTETNDPGLVVSEVNSIVDIATNSHLPTFLEHDVFSKNPMDAVLLSILHINNSWAIQFEDKDIQFKGKKETTDVEGFGNTIDLIYDETSGFQGWSLSRWNEVTIILPATDNTSLMVRMRDDGTVHPIDHTHIQTFFDKKITHKKIDFSMPTFTIENTVNLKNLLKNAMPKLMGKTFAVDLFEIPNAINVGSFLQKNKLDVTKNGLEKAPKLSAMTTKEKAPVTKRTYKKITINNPFSFAVIKETLSKNRLILFTGEVFEPIPAQKSMLLNEEVILYKQCIKEKQENLLLQTLS